MFCRNHIIIATICIAAFALLHPVVLPAQNTHNQNNIFFYHLNTSQGLSDNYIYDMCTDKSGNLWVGTGEGLNMFNGKLVTKYFKEEYPQLQNDFTRQVLCDDDNRIWVLSEGGFVTMIDENRRFHKIALYRNGRAINTNRILKTKTFGIILFTNEHFISLIPGKNFSTIDSLSTNDFSTIEVKGFTADYAKQFSQAEPFGEDCYIVSTKAKFVKINFKEKQTEHEFEWPGLNILAPLNNDELLVYDKINQTALSIVLSSGKINKPLLAIKDQYGKEFSARIRRALVIKNDQLWLTTADKGLFLFNTATKKMYHFGHNAADPATISNNSPSVIIAGPAGWVFIGNTPNGVNYFKIDAVIGQQLFFTDNKGNAYDGFIHSIATLDNDNYYIGVSDNLLHWQRSTNHTQFIATDNDELGIIKNYGVNYVTFDNKKRKWIAVLSVGVFVLDENNKLIKHFKYDSLQANGIPSNMVGHIQMDNDGKFMWLSTWLGLCKIDINSLKIDRLKYLPVDVLAKTHCYRSWFQNRDNIWIATENKGAWHYTFSSKKLQQYSLGHGGISNHVFCFNKDTFNNIYVGTADGLQILLNNGKTKIFTPQNGLLHKRIEALLLDKDNRMWIGNDIGICCFNIADTSVRVFDERYGLSVQGFRINSYHQNSNDELLWGTERGLQYFYPDKLLKQTIGLTTTINRVETRDIVTDITKSVDYNLSSTDNYVTFYFSTIDYSQHLRTFYEYMLEGLDKNWIKVTDQNFVRYSSLPTGKYIFKVRASNDGKLWAAATNTVTITIAKPIWQQTWFKILAFLVSLLLVWFVVQYYRHKQTKQKEELETEVVINYFASRINVHRKTEDILWDIAKNCISKLNFEDCVIYLIDEKRKVLVQKAAYGPKNPVDFTIHKPIEIPMGKGIVGAVAQSGKSELVHNTETDSRYIVDDERRFSEIAVPIIIDDEIAGVIDSEHSRKHFFTQKHLGILTTVAALCASQMQRTRAEEEKQKAKIELLENKQRAVESRLQSLRLQMNPHFLFNALNSIQQMILANEEMVATKYLSRFSKLLRTILVHSDNETVTLKEEIEILNLYVELESVRFKDKFTYTIICDEDIDVDEIKVPTLLIQPFVENAIWHGLMHKDGNKELTIEFTETANFICCIVQDNGIGRDKAAALKVKTGQDKTHKSKGIGVSVERLKNMRNAAGDFGELHIVDLTDENKMAAGTRVELHFPI